MDTLEITNIPAGALLIDPDLQARSGSEPEHVERLSRTDPSTWPPLVVTPAPGGKYAILDGAHRFLAGQKLELEGGKVVRLKAYACRVIQAAGYAESFQLNSEHPLTLSTGDRKTFAKFLKKNNPSLSNREIAKRCGLGRRTVDALFIQKDEPLPGPQNSVKKFIALLVRMHEEGDVSSEVVAEALISSKNPALAAKALQAWVKASLEVIRAMGKG